MKGNVLEVRVTNDWLKLMKLVVITSGDPDRYAEIVSKAVLSGCRAIQLRDKQLDDKPFIRIARDIKKICETRGALFFINDRVDAAMIVGSSGVHLGVGDINVADARSLLCPGTIIGYSPEGENDATEAIRSGADYLGIGPVYGTETKEDAGEPIGIEGLSRYCGEGAAPVIAVGGIGAVVVGEVMKAGASGVAVSSAVSGAEDPESEVRGILARIEAGR